MQFSEKTVKIMRNTAAVLWLSSAFFATPLAFLRLSGGKVPFYGLLEAVTLPVLAVAAAAVAAAGMDFRIYFRDTRWRVLGIAQIAVLLVSLWHWYQGVPGESMLLTGFIVLAPVVGAALKRELENVLPWTALFWAVILLISGVNSENFTGLAGNWNWTQALLAALLPGGVFLLRSPHRKWLAVFALFVFGAWVWYKYPEQFSRAVLLAVTGAAGILAMQHKWQHALWLRKISPWYFFIPVTLIFLLTAVFADIADSRFQLWKGATDLWLAKPHLGVGMGNFAPEILRFLPEKYYFTEFAAPWHPHPHNEFLNFICAYGIAGAAYLYALVYMALRYPVRNDREMLARWIFLVLMICGMFDLTCAIIPGAVWCFTCAGISGGRYREPVAGNIWRLLPAAGLLLLAGWMCREQVISTAALRQGKLALFRKDDSNAEKFLQQSAELSGQYHLAELYLLRFNAPQQAKCTLAGMKQEYLHSARLRAITAFRLGDHKTALAAMEKERRNYPYSVINARLWYLLLRSMNAPQAQIIEAEQVFIALCRLRGITPAQAAVLTPENDDMPLKYPSP